MRSIALGASVGVFVRLVCFPFVLRDFRGIVRGARRVCRVGFPLAMLSGSIFSPLLAFRVFVRVLTRVRGFRALVGVFRGFRGCAGPLALLRDDLAV